MYTLLQTLIEPDNSGQNGTSCQLCHSFLVISWCPRQKEIHSCYSAVLLHWTFFWDFSKAIKKLQSCFESRMESFKPDKISLELKCAPITCNAASLFLREQLSSNELACDTKNNVAVQQVFSFIRNDNSMVGIQTSSNQVQICLLEPSLEKRGPVDQKQMCFLFTRSEPGCLPAWLELETKCCLWTPT